MIKSKQVCNCQNVGIDENRDVDLSKIDQKYDVGQVERLSTVCRVFDQSISKRSARQRARRTTFFNQGQ